MAVTLTDVTTMTIEKILRRLAQNFARLRALALPSARDRVLVEPPFPRTFFVFRAPFFFPPHLLAQKMGVCIFLFICGFRQRCEHDTQFTGPQRRRKNVVGTLKLVRRVCGLVRINPILLFDARLQNCLVYFATSMM
jgi:hypothetical protein